MEHSANDSWRRSAETDCLGLYVHIPFCSSICSYCNFNRGLLDHPLKRRYISALITEIERAGDGSKVDTIYFGGGTPSLLLPDEIQNVFKACQKSFDVSSDAEVTLEMNPETVSRSYVASILDIGVTRLSIGVQSFNDRELERLGREHTAETAVNAFLSARNAGCDNVSLDLMLSLPEQTREKYARSIEKLVQLSPDHASLYILELYPNAPLESDISRKGWSLPKEEDAALMYLEALERTAACGLEQYEISNLARSGKRSRHNLKYWEDGSWLGFGCGAHSTRSGWRWRNLSETERYVDRIERSAEVALDRRLLGEKERLGDALFMGLRLAEGLDLVRIRYRYGVDVMDRYGAELRKFTDSGLLVESENRLRLTRQGMLLANEVMSTFV